MARRAVSKLPRLTRAGAILFGLAIAGFAVQNLCGTQIIRDLEPLPASLPGFAIWALGNSFVLLGAGAGIVFCAAAGVSAIRPASVLGILLSLWIVLLDVRVLIRTPAKGDWWICLFETFAIAGPAWFLAGLEAGLRTEPGQSSKLATWGTKLGSLAYGIALLAFGVLHIVYVKYVTSLVPSWIPGHLFWAWFTTFAFFAAGVSIIVQIKAHWAALWTGIMFFSWVLMLHLPRVLKAPKDPEELSNLTIALVTGAGAWIVAQNSGATGHPGHLATVA